MEDAGVASMGSNEGQVCTMIATRLNAEHAGLEAIAKKTRRPACPRLHSTWELNVIQCNNAPGFGGKTCLSLILPSMSTKRRREENGFLVTTKAKKARSRSSAAPVHSLPGLLPEMRLGIWRYLTLHETALLARTCRRLHIELSAFRLFIPRAWITVPRKATTYSTRSGGGDGKGMMERARELGLHRLKLLHGRCKGFQRWTHGDRQGVECYSVVWTTPTPLRPIDAGLGRGGLRVETFRAVRHSLL